MSHLKIGDNAPAINSVDLNGDAITLEQFKGKNILDKNGVFQSIKVLKGAALPEDMHGVDGITGGTITSDGVTEMLERTLKIYVPYIKGDI